MIFSFSERRPKTVADGSRFLSHVILGNFEPERLRHFPFHLATGTAVELLLKKQTTYLTLDGGVRFSVASFVGLTAGLFTIYKL